MIREAPSILAGVLFAVRTRHFDKIHTYNPRRLSEVSVIQRRTSMRAVMRFKGTNVELFLYSLTTMFYV